MTESGFPFFMMVWLAGVFIFWTAAYVLIIWRGFRDRICGMPAAALCANIAWEFIYLFVFPQGMLRTLATAIWLVLDVIIFLQFVVFSKGLWSSARFKVTALALFLAIAFTLQVSASIDLHDPEGTYTGFAINLMMSILFIAMLLTRGHAGQSVLIGYAKMLGTFCASVVSYTQYPDSMFLTVSYVLIVILDALYIYLLYAWPGKQAAVT